ncbi:hypothetical protein EYF80_033659 [Liparis tanakae]|uniref:Uncharacterized protein n=1 Tax=Liparis tanakae TaxID=230148 RepID=A0A4Z2GRU5_9TELE|nr:hypothetical protein EYF80_033659 [Liparis tanakae]
MCKVSWTEVLNSDIGRGNSSHIRSQRRRFTDIRHKQMEIKLKEEEEEEETGGDKESHRMKRENYFSSRSKQPKDARLTAREFLPRYRDIQSPTASPPFHPAQPVILTEQGIVGRHGINRLDPRCDAWPQIRTRSLPERLQKRPAGITASS